MNEQEFIIRCKTILGRYINSHFDKSEAIPDFEIYTVWQCKTLQNNKALMSTTLPDGMYYEFTYNGDKRSIYFDAYKKFENIVIQL